MRQRPTSAYGIKGKACAPAFTLGGASGCPAAVATADRAVVVARSPWRQYAGVSRDDLTNLVVHAILRLAEEVVDTGSRTRRSMQRTRAELGTEVPRASHGCHCNSRAPGKVTPPTCSCHIHQSSRRWPQKVEWLEDDDRLKLQAARCAGGLVHPGYPGRHFSIAFRPNGANVPGAGPPMSR